MNEVIKKISKLMSFKEYFFKRKYLKEYDKSLKHIEKHGSLMSDGNYIILNKNNQYLRFCSTTGSSLWEDNKSKAEIFSRLQAVQQIILSPEAIKLERISQYGN